MELTDKIARYQEIERRGLLDQLPLEKQQAWAEIKRRGLDVEQQKQDNYSALDKAKYIGRAGAEGLTFGLGDVVGGITNTLMAPIGKTVNHFVEGTPLTASDFNPVKNFKQGRKEFVEEQNAFKEEHPWLNAGGEAVGGLTTGVIGAGKAMAGNAAKTGIRGVLNGAKVGGFYGGAYGVGSGATENPDEISAMGAVKGFVPGALVGGAFGAAIPTVSTVWHAITKPSASKNAIKIKDVLSNKMPAKVVDNIANNEAVRNEAARGYMPQRMSDFEENATNALKKAADDIQKVKSHFYRTEGITNDTPINLLETGDNGVSYLRQIYNRVQNFKKNAITPEEVKLGEQMEGLFTNIKNKAKNGRIPFGESKALTEKMYKLSQMQSKLPSETALYRDIGSIISDAKNSIPQIKRAGSRYAQIKRAEEGLEKLLGDKETSFAQKIIRNATDRGHGEFNKQLQDIDKTLKLYGMKGFLDDVKILQTARLLEQADKTGIKNLVPNSITNPKSWVKWLTPKAGTQARYWANAVNNGAVNPHDLNASVNASNLPFIGDILTQARALGKARFGVGGVTGKPITIYGNELGKIGKIVSKNRAFRKGYQNSIQGQIVDNPQINGIKITKRARKEIPNKTPNGPELDVLYSIPEILRRATFGKKEGLYKTRKDSYADFSTGITPIVYKGEQKALNVNVAHEKNKGPVLNTLHFDDNDTSRLRTGLYIPVHTGSMNSIANEGKNVNPKIKDILFSEGPMGLYGSIILSPRQMREILIKKNKESN